MEGLVHAGQAYLDLLSSLKYIRAVSMETCDDKFWGRGWFQNYLVEMKLDEGRVG